MTSTALAEFDNGKDGFKVGDRVKVADGAFKGQEGAVEEALSTGYYVVKIDGQTRLTLFDFHEIEPFVERVDYGPTPPYGMTSAQLAEEVASAVTRATSRVVGTGRSQYEFVDHQKFEVMDLADLIEYTLEEADDLINYSVMVQIRMRRLRDELRRKGTI